MLELRENGVAIKRVAENSTFRLPNGDRVSPAYAGWTQGAFTLVEITLTPQPPSAADPITEARKGQFQLALIQLGYWGPFQAFLASAAQEVRDSWDRCFRVKAQAVNLQDFLTYLAGVTGKTAGELREEIFSLADTLSDSF